MDQSLSPSERKRQDILAKPVLDAGRNSRGKIGFVLIPNEQTIEEDMIRYMPPGVGAYFDRLTMPREISTEKPGTGARLIGNSGRAHPTR